MIAWVIIIVVLAIFEILAVSYPFPEIYIYISTILLFVALLGLVYKVYRDKRDKESRE